MGVNPGRKGSGPAILIHAVSLGEINASRAMVQALEKARPDLEFIISVTTDTGHDRGVQLYGSNPKVTLIRYPLDFSAAICRVLDRLRPSLVVLMELEVWPNFVLHCQRRGIPVLLVNGRLTPGSFRNYRLGTLLVRKMFNRLSAICAQEQIYADRFIALGAPPDRVSVTGTMKFDTAQLADRIEGDVELAIAVGLRPGEEKIWVCGSTGPGEEQIILLIHQQLIPQHPTLRLVIVPRKPERFDEVATLVQAKGFDLLRRSQSQKGAEPAPARDLANRKSQIPQVVLGDTMGELRKSYSLADIVFVGRSLVDLGARQHGSDMIEPAALAKPIIVGPYTGNFAEVMNSLRIADAVREVHTAEQLRQQVAQLLGNPREAAEMGRRAQDVVRQNQGATARHVQLILQYLPFLQNLQ